MSVVSSEDHRGSHIGVAGKLQDSFVRAIIGKYLSLYSIALSECTLAVFVLQWFGDGTGSFPRGDNALQHEYRNI